MWKNLWITPPSLALQGDVNLQHFGVQQAGGETESREGADSGATSGIERGCPRQGRGLIESEPINHSFIKT